MTVSIFTLESFYMSCMLLYVFDMFHILLSGDSLRDLWNAYICVCICTIWFSDYSSTQH